MASKHEMIDIILRYYRYVDGKSLPSLYSLFTNDIIYERSGNPPLIGMQAFKHFYENIRPIQEGRHEMLDIIVEGETAVVRGRFKGTLKNGQKVDFGFADFFVFEGEKVSKRYTYTDLGTT